MTVLKVTSTDFLYSFRIDIQISFLKFSNVVCPYNKSFEPCLIFQKFAKLIAMEDLYEGWMIINLELVLKQQFPCKSES